MKFKYKKLQIQIYNDRKKLKANNISISSSISLSSYSISKGSEYLREKVDSICYNDKESVKGTKDYLPIEKISEVGEEYSRDAEIHHLDTMTPNFKGIDCIGLLNKQDSCNKMTSNKIIQNYEIMSKEKNNSNYLKSFPDNKQDVSINRTISDISENIAYNNSNINYDNIKNLPPTFELSPLQNIKESAQKPLVLTCSPTPIKMDHHDSQNIMTINKIDNFEQDLLNNNQNLDCGNKENTFKSPIKSSPIILKSESKQKNNIDIETIISSYNIDTSLLPIKEESELDIAHQASIDVSIINKPSESQGIKDNIITENVLSVRKEEVINTAPFNPPETNTAQEKTFNLSISTINKDINNFSARSKETSSTSKNLLSINNNITPSLPVGFNNMNSITQTTTVPNSNKGPLQNLIDNPFVCKPSNQLSGNQAIQNPFVQQSMKISNPFVNTYNNSSETLNSQNNYIKSNLDNNRYTSSNTLGGITFNQLNQNSNSFTSNSNFNSSNPFSTNTANNRSFVSFPQNIENNYVNQNHGFQSNQDPFKNINSFNSSMNQNPVNNFNKNNFGNTVDSSKIHGCNNFNNHSSENFNTFNMQNSNEINNPFAEASSYNSFSSKPAIMNPFSTVLNDKGFGSTNTFSNAQFNHPQISSDNYINPNPFMNAPSRNPSSNFQNTNSSSSLGLLVDHEPTRRNYGTKIPNYHKNR